MSTCYYCSVRVVYITLTCMLLTSWRTSLERYLQSPSSTLGSFVEVTFPISPTEDNNNVHNYTCTFT